MKCQARITKEYKSKKADVVWPVNIGGLIPNHLKFPRCEGDVTATVELQDDGSCSDPDCCGGPNYDIEIKLECSRCKHPFIPHISLKGYYEKGLFLSDLVTRFIEDLKEPDEPSTLR